MEFFIENWYIFFAILAAVIGVGIAIYVFFMLPRDEQLEKLSEWLLWACTKAEQDLGSGTGQIKLRQVYDMFVTRFPWLAKIISFTRFKVMVDKALEKMDELLKTNPAVKALVEGDRNDQMQGGAEND